MRTDGRLLFFSTRAAMARGCASGRLPFFSMRAAMARGSRKKRKKGAKKGAKLPMDHIDGNILSEILLRLPPQPSSLPRVSAVSKRWRSLACNPGFCRRFRLHHRRNAPLLGYFNHPGFESLSFVPTLDAPNGVLPGRFSTDDPYVSCGSRHGLLLMIDQEDFCHILVWDPVTGDQYSLDIPPEFKEHAIRGAVVREAGDVHFRVLLVLEDTEDGQHGRALARVYSSETNLWGDLISMPLHPW